MTASDTDKLLKQIQEHQAQNDRALESWLIELAKKDNKKALEIRDLIKQAKATIDNNNLIKLAEIQNKIEALCR